jgi:hypothetical protein
VPNGLESVVTTMLHGAGGVSDPRRDSRRHLLSTLDRRAVSRGAGGTVTPERDVIDEDLFAEDE